MSADAVSPLTFAIGDIHGCLDKLNRLIAACEARAAGRPARYVFVGDYIDRGPHSRDVIEFLRERQAERLCLLAGIASSSIRSLLDRRAQICPAVTR